ncbi:MAG: YicC/YloC family endoribonuclease [Bacteroidota bacterium]|jgi:uncharacterized protein (TIGR00255 family)
MKNLMKSMTGFGRAQGVFQGKQIELEIRSLNSKGLDLSLRLPQVLNEKEAEIRALMTKHVERGKVSLAVYSGQSELESSMYFNAPLAKQYLMAFKSFADANGISEKAVTDAVFKIPDVFRPEKTSMDENDWSQFEGILHSAIQHFDRFRLDEGAHLFTAFHALIASISGALAAIEELDQQRLLAVRQRLKQHVQTLSADIKLDENRFEQEVLYYMEKLDITEEKTRLRAHLAYFTETMVLPSSGRKLGFISQEIGREINTIGSKAADADMQKKVVEMKDDLEKIKEQLNNIL